MNEQCTGCMDTSDHMLDENDQFDKDEFMGNLKNDKEYNEVYDGIDFSTLC